MFRQLSSSAPAPYIHHTGRGDQSGDR